MNHDAMRLTRPTSKGTGGDHIYFLTAFYTPLGCASHGHHCTLISVHTFWIHSIHTASKQRIRAKMRKHTNKTISFHFTAIFSFSVLSFSPSNSLSRFHIQTHSHSGGVIECDSKSWEGCWRVIRLTCEMEPTWHQQVGSDTYSRHGWITPATTGG